MSPDHLMERRNAHRNCRVPQVSRVWRPGRPQKPARLLVPCNLSRAKHAAALLTPLTPPTSLITLVHCPFVTSHPQNSFPTIKGYCALLGIRSRKATARTPKGLGRSRLRE